MSEHSASPMAEGFSIGDRLFGVGLAAAAILVPALIVKIHFLEERAPFKGSPQSIGGMLVAALALLIAACNLRLRFGTSDSNRSVSGTAIVGGILVLIAALLLTASPVAGGWLLLLYLTDPFGIHVAAVVIFSEMFRRPCRR